MTFHFNKKNPVKYKKEIELPTSIPCTKDDGIMLLCRDGYYRCINVCANEISAKEIIKEQEKLFDL